MTTILTEKVHPRGINTDISPKAIEEGNQGNRVLVNPVLDCLNKHYHTSENGMSMEIENIRGTTTKSNSLPSGTNVCIGTYEDKLNNQLIFWNYNSNNNHGVYAYSPETDAITTLLQVAGLAFQNDRRYLVTGVGSIGSLLYWSDGINPQRVINMTRSYGYGTFSLTHITVIKPHPITRIQVGENDYYEAPSLDRTYDSAIKTNNVTDKNIQFSYRYKYLDNEYSVIAPYSVVSLADFDPDQFNASMTRQIVLESNPATLTTQTYSYKNKIRVRLTVPSVPSAFIKNIELLFRENNSGDWSIWKTLPVANVDTYFSKSESLVVVDQTESSKLFEAIPNFSKALAVTKNRLFINSGEEGFDVNDSPTIAITEKAINIAQSTSTSTIVMAVGSKTFVDAGGTTYTLGERIRLVDSTNSARSITGIVTAIAGSTITFYVDTVTSATTVSTWNIFKITVNATNPATPIFVPSDIYKPYFKTNGTYIVSIAVFDGDQRCMGIISKTQYNVSLSTISILDLSGGTAFNFFPMRKGDIFISAVLTGNFATSPKVKYYSLAISSEQVYQQYVQTLVRPLFYRFDKPTGYTLAGHEVEIDGKIFEKFPDATNFNRIYLQMPLEMPFVPDTNYFVRIVDSSSVSTVNKVLDVIGDFLVIASFETSFPLITQDILFVEIFSPKTVNDGLFYEITDRYSVDGSGNLSQLTFDPIYGDNYRPGILADYPNGSSPFFNVNRINQSFRTLAPFANLPPYISNMVTFPLLNPEIPTPTTKSSGSTPITPAFPSNFAVSTYKRSLFPDYLKIASNKGKTIVEIQDKKALQRPSVIRYSNKFVQDTNINGMSSFDAGNQKQVQFDIGPIIKLVPIGNRMLAITEWGAATIYLEEKMIKTADGGGDQLIAAPEEAIGYIRVLQDGGWGSFHAESIISTGDAVFGYDIYSGVVWRYTNEGQFPISDYGRKQYFRDKSTAYIGNKNAVKILGGHDLFHKEYLITFNDGTGASETIAFNYVKNVWTTRYSYIPEYYGKINNKLISFKAGALWVHNDSSTYNNFYGVQYGSFITMAVNPHPTRIKNAVGVDLDVEALSVTADYKEIEIFTDEGQESYLRIDEFDKKENVFYADILRDINTPNINTKFKDIDFAVSATPYSINLDSGVFEIGRTYSLNMISTTPISSATVLVKIDGNVIFSGTVTGILMVTVPFAYTGQSVMTILVSGHAITVGITGGSLALRDGDDMRSRYFKVKINDDSTTKNLIQQLNLNYVMSEYSE